MLRKLLFLIGLSTCHVWADYDLPDFKDGEILKAAQLASIVTAVNDLAGRTSSSENIIAEIDIALSQNSVDIESLSSDSRDSRLRYFALGDSITAAESSWAVKLNASMSFSEFNNVAVDGASVMSIPGRSRLCDQVNLVEEGTSLITVLIGVNDFTSGVPLGDPYSAVAKPFSDLNYETNFSDAFRLSMETIKREHAKARIYVLLPLQTTWESGAGSVTLSDFRESMTYIANSLSIPVIRTNDESGLWAFDPNNKLMADGLHPNDQGHEILAAYVERKIKSM
jgi:lysophospholipase L1-like esterase